MPINVDNIKAAFDEFVDDNFDNAKEILKKEIKVAKDEFINKKLGEPEIENDDEPKKKDDKDE